jgi:hypothetical protein
MGYIVYSETTGRAERYYKLERTAKQQATRLNKEPQSPWRTRETYAHCSYAAYEGVLMGLKGENLRYWSWMKSA